MKTKVTFNKKWAIYMIRWQISGFVMLPFMAFLEANLPLWGNLMVGSLFGGMIFWFVDKKIFHHTPKSKGKDYEDEESDYELG